MITSDEIYAVSESAYQPNKLDEVGFGTYTVSGNNLIANDMQYFSFADGVQTADIVATFVEGDTLSGTATLEDGTTLPFSLSYNEYFDESADLSSIVGISRGETGSRPGYGNTLVEIDNGGSFVGITEDNCSYSGVLTANSDGVAFYDESKNALYVMALNANGSEGIIYWGIKFYKYWSKRYQFCDDRIV